MRRPSPLQARPGRTRRIAGRIIHAEGAAAEGARVAVYAVREGAPGGNRRDGHQLATTGDMRSPVFLPVDLLVGVTPQRDPRFRRRLPPPDVSGDGNAVSRHHRPNEGAADRRIRRHGHRGYRHLARTGRPALLDQRPRVVARRRRLSRNVVIEYGGPEDVHRGIWYVTDPGGLFTVEGASRGTYVLLARADTPNGPLIGIAATDVTNDSVQDVRLTLRPPGSIEGRIVVEGNRQPGSLRRAPDADAGAADPVAAVPSRRMRPRTAPGALRCRTCLGSSRLRSTGCHPDGGSGAFTRTVPPFPRTM